MALIYTEKNNGEVSVRIGEDRDVNQWRKLGEELGYRFFYGCHTYYKGKEQVVIIFTNRVWSDEEIERRERQGFKGIKRYRIKKEV